MFLHLMRGKWLCYGLSGEKENIQLCPLFLKCMCVFAYTSLKKKKQPERKRLDGGIVGVWLFFFLETLVFSKFTTITQLLL